MNITKKKNNNLRSLENLLLIIAILFSIIIGLIGGVPSALSLLGYIIIMLFWLYYNRDVTSISLKKSHWLRYILIGMSSGILTAILASIIFLNFHNTSAHFFQLPIIFSEMTGIESLEIIKILFPISYIIGALIHELFYRGFLQNRISIHIKPIYSVLIVAVLFGWGHFPEGAFSVIIGFYEGIICGLLLNKTGSIITPWLFRIFHIGTIFIVLGVL